MTNLIQHQALDQHSVKHGFFTRNGGVSSGRYHSLNCGIGSHDDPALISKNQTIALSALDLEKFKLRTAWQIHSSVVKIIDQSTEIHDRPKCDALITNNFNVPLGVLTADCAPILLSNYKAQVIAATHAGWKGALGGIIKSTVDAMSSLGALPKYTVAIIGPTIGPQSYEVSRSFAEPFINLSLENKRFFNPALNELSLMFDLPEFIKNQLQLANIGLIDTISADTYADSDRFFSYRRTCHNGGGDYGRLLSLISLEI